MVPVTTKQLEFYTLSVNFLTWHWKFLIFGISRDIYNWWCSVTIGPWRSIKLTCHGPKNDLLGRLLVYFMWFHVPPFARPICFPEFLPFLPVFSGWNDELFHLLLAKSRVFPGFFVSPNSPSKPSKASKLPGLLPQSSQWYGSKPVPVGPSGEPWPFEEPKSWDLSAKIMGFMIYHLVMTNIAMENPNHKWRFIAGNIICKWAIYTMANC